MKQHSVESDLMQTETIILRVAVQTPLWRYFDYLPISDRDAHAYQEGMRVQIPFGKRKIIGIIVDIATDSTVPMQKLKRIISLIDQTPLISPSLMQLYRFASDYYHHPLGDVILGTLPKWIREGRDIALSEKTEKKINHLQISSIVLNRDQENAIEKISQSSGFKPFLLAGVTGSGKTEVYINAIAKLKPEQQALVLVPEIALTPQTVRRFSQRFDKPVVMLHSKLPHKKRLEAWAMANAGVAKIIIGTRSAIFAPMTYPGMIIVDEEHDLSFKSQSGFRYSARDLAMIRGQIENIPVVLGSATPSLETLANVNRNRYQCLSLPQRAGDAHLPEIKTINLKGKSSQGGITDELMQEIKKHLNKNQQVLLFLNRRGYAPILMCHHCGWMALCKHCDARLTLHQSPRKLFCHHCGYSCHPMRICLACQQAELISKGIGTEQLEAVLQNCFPDQSILRIDRDTMSSRKKMDLALEKAHKQEANILIGTQMLAKGHHFENLTLVAIIDTDSGFFTSDFRSTERMAQLIMQVAGRAGRAKEKGQVILQTHHPDHPLMTTLIHQGYDAFSRILLEERKNIHLPPYAHLALLKAESKHQDKSIAFLEKIKSAVDHFRMPQIDLLGPIPAVMERKADYFRAQLLLQTQERKRLQFFLKKLTHVLETTEWSKNIRWSLDVDPMLI